jgi:hypothetical protein
MHSIRRRHLLYTAARHGERDQVEPISLPSPLVLTKRERISRSGESADPFGRPSRRCHVSVDCPQGRVGADVDAVPCAAQPHICLPYLPRSLGIYAELNLSRGPGCGGRARAGSARRLTPCVRMHSLDSLEYPRITL